MRNSLWHVSVNLNTRVLLSAEVEVEVEVLPTVDLKVSLFLSSLLTATALQPEEGERSRNQPGVPEWRRPVLSRRKEVQVHSTDVTLAKHPQV